MTTPIRGWVSRSSAASRIPSSDIVGGIATSSSTTSSGSRSMSSINASPSSHAATSSIPGVLSSILVSASRISRLSSANPTRRAIARASPRAPCVARARAPRGPACGHPVSAVRRGLGLGEEDERRLDALADLLDVGEVELEEDRVDVLLDGALGEDELLGDRAVALALSDLCEHLALARRELRERRALRPRLRGDERLDDLRVHHRAAGGDGLDRRQQLRAVVDALLE